MVRPSEMSFVVLPILVLGCFLLAAAGRADDTTAIDKELNRTYKDQVLALRNFYGGKLLRYDGDGRLAHGGHPGFWTLDAEVRVHRIRVRNKQIEIGGKRILLAYDLKHKQFGPVDEDRDVRVEIAYSPGVLNMTEIQGLMAKVFLSRNEKLSDYVPAYWDKFFSGPGRGSAPNKHKSLLFGVQQAPLEVQPDSGVIPPAPVHTPNPGYSEEARRARTQGELALWLAIGNDGRVEDAVLVRPLGSGLDEQALETVSTWRFKPATKDGVPIQVIVYAEVSFNLFP